MAHSSQGHMALAQDRAQQELGVLEQVEVVEVRVCDEGGQVQDVRVLELDAGGQELGVEVQQESLDHVGEHGFEVQKMQTVSGEIVLGVV